MTNATQSPLPANRNEQVTSPPIPVDPLMREEVLVILAGATQFSWRMERRWWQQNHRLTITGPAWKVSEVKSLIAAAADQLWWDVQW
jgi:hypothetical protein